LEKQYNEDDQGQWAIVADIAPVMLSEYKDVAFAWDYDCTGREDHIVIYRPGFG
jgi:hypothetical protein